MSFQLSQACITKTADADRAPAQAKDDLVSTICRKEMGVYTQIFSNMGETAQLERTERRYGWLRKRLRAREEVWKVFPETWRLPQLLCLAFCSITKAQLAEILDFKVRCCLWALCICV